jgi:transcriptional adapter 2-alpha
LKVFSRLQTAADHEEFANGLLYEQMLRKQINDLQEYRQAGLTTFAEVDRYEKDKSARIASRGANNYRDAILLSRSSVNRPASGGPSREGTPKPPSSAPARKLPQPQLTLSNAASLQLLTPVETQLCSELRILPKPFLVIKQTLLREFARHGGQLDRQQAPELFPKLEPNAVEKVWDLLFSKIIANEQGRESDDEDDEDDSSDDGVSNVTSEQPLAINGNDSSDSSSEGGNLMEELQEILKLQAQAQAQEEAMNLEEDLFGANASVPMETEQS